MLFKLGIVADIFCLCCVPFSHDIAWMQPQVHGEINIFWACDCACPYACVFIENQALLISSNLLGS